MYYGCCAPDSSGYPAAEGGEARAARREEYERIAGNGAQKEKI